MSNSKGNAYPNWIITNEFQVFAVDSQNVTHSMSNTNFASDIGVAEDGTIWAVSLEPDPDGGGAKIYWSNGDGNWNEIATSDPGAVRISGGTGSSCIYLSFDQVLRSMDTDGTSTVLYDTDPVYDADYGGGMIWALLSDKPGEPISLHYANAGTSPLTFTAFTNNVYPTSLSVGYQGNCYGVVDYSPLYFSTDGKTSGSAGSGLSGKTLRISSKNWSYAISSDISKEGSNEVYVWKDTAGGTFVNAGYTAMLVLATFYTA